MRYFWLFLLVLSAAAAPPKKIVILAGRKSHGPGLHEYVKSAQLLKVMLERSVSSARVEVHFNGWPENPATLDTADTIVTISDGQDGELYNPVPFMTPERMLVMERQMKRGCGFGVIHFSTFAPDKYGPQMLAWGGGYFDWQDDTGARKWYSAIKTLDTRVEPAAEGHPALRGIVSFDLKEEFYYQIRFPENRAGWKPLVRVPALGGTADAQTVAWAVERPDGGRGFGTSMGHFYSNWNVPAYRRFLLNAIAWSAGVEVPAAGVESAVVEETSAVLVPRPVKALLLTTDEHTAPLIEDLNNRGPEFAVTVTEDASQLAHLEGYQLLVLHDVDWRTAGGSEAAKAGVARHLERGGGLVSIHATRPGHEAAEAFAVQLAGHALTRGMAGFETSDDRGAVGAGEVIATWQGRPIAVVYRVGRGRVFETTLGHSANSLRNSGTTQLIRRGATWAARRK